MTPSLVRKLIYVGVIVALFIPLFLLGNPPSYTKEDGHKSGGLLSQMREEHRLGQVQLGKIDIAGESLKVSTFGLRGIATSVLWVKTMQDRKTEDWDALTATLNQIKRMQPNYIYIWEYQAHNLAYNISAEFDNYKHRYHWVKKGIDYLVEGTLYNTSEPRLLDYLGWFTGHKIGMSDEKREFRELFRKDTDFHLALKDYIPDITSSEVNGPDGTPDNWLTGRLWYIKAKTAVDELGKSLRGKSPTVFHSNRAKSIMNYAEAIQEEGYFDEAAMSAWRRAGKAWDDFGKLTLPGDYGEQIQLARQEEYEEKAELAIEELGELLPGVREQVVKQRRADLDDAARKLVDTPLSDRGEWSPKDWNDHRIAFQSLIASHRDVALQAPSDIRPKALSIAQRIEELSGRAEYIERSRRIVNYQFWKTRCESEQTPLVVGARKLLYAAAQKLKNAELEDALADYDSAWDEWDQIFKRWPQLIETESKENLNDALKSYRRTLRQLNRPDIPPDFKLGFLVEEQEMFALRARQAVLANRKGAKGKPRPPVEVFPYTTTQPKPQPPSTPPPQSQSRPQPPRESP